MIIKLSGGLGNQLFQYALGCALAEELGVEIIYDEGNYRKDRRRQVLIRNIGFNYKKISAVQNFLWTLKSKMKKDDLWGIYKDTPEFEYHQISRKTKYLIGSWQNKKYFSNIRKKLVEEINFDYVLNDYQKQMVLTMQQENSVAVHVRRTDYLQLSDIYAVPKIDYYFQAMQYIEKEYGSCRFYFFSDDISWCKQHFEDKQNYVFVDADISTLAVCDFELMRNCKGFIIANSTFSWWASWLSQAENKIMIAPKVWFCEERYQCRIKDAILDEYILL